MRDDYRLRARLADAESLARRLIDIEARLGIRVDGAAKVAAAADRRADRRAGGSRREGRHPRRSVAARPGAGRRARPPRRRREGPAGAAPARRRPRSRSVRADGRIEAARREQRRRRRDAGERAPHRRLRRRPAAASQRSHRVRAPRPGPTRRRRPRHRRARRRPPAGSAPLSTQLRDLLDPATLTDIRRLETTGTAGGIAAGARTRRRRAARPRRLAGRAVARDARPGASEVTRGTARGRGYTAAECGGRRLRASVDSDPARRRRRSASAPARRARRTSASRRRTASTTSCAPSSASSTTATPTASSRSRAPHEPRSSARSCSGSCVSGQLADQVAPRQAIAWSATAAAQDLRRAGGAQRERRDRPVVADVADGAGPRAPGWRRPASTTRPSRAGRPKAIRPASGATSARWRRRSSCAPGSSNGVELGVAAGYRWLRVQARSRLRLQRADRRRSTCAGCATPRGGADWEARAGAAPRVPQLRRPGAASGNCPPDGLPCPGTGDARRRLPDGAGRRHAHGPRAARRRLRVPPQRARTASARR